jgi:hypothetical protein
MDPHEFVADSVALLDRQVGVGAARKGGQDDFDRGRSALAGMVIIERLEGGEEVKRP